MSKRRLLWTLIGGTITFSLIAIIVSLATPRVCPAIGSAYIGPIEIKLQGLNQASRVAACFGIECKPWPVLRSNDDQWLVPQEPPFLNADSHQATRGNPDKIRVSVTGTEVRTDRVYEIPTRHSSEIGDWACPGPVKYLPVTVP